MSTLKVDGIRSNSASSDAITLASDGTCTANITNNLSNRNLIINGAMQVAQRGTSAASDGYGSLDRFSSNNANNDEMPTQSQEDVASGTTPYTSGFRKCFRMTNGNQTSGAGAADRVCILYDIEAQDIANSGWNYVSSSSNITLSFWVKSSVAQNFYVLLRSRDGTERGYVFETGSLTADTWTKITKTISGNTSPTIQIDNDTGSGMQIEWNIFRGTDKTGSVTLNQWATFDGSARVPDMTSTWYTTNDATFEITGVQLEVGSVATDFEHRSYGQELELCKRYYQQPINGINQDIAPCAFYYSAGHIALTSPIVTPMRTTPTVTVTQGTGYYKLFSSANASGEAFQPTPELGTTVSYSFYDNSGVSGTAGVTGFARTKDASAKIEYSAEL